MRQEEDVSAWARRHWAAVAAYGRMPGPPRRGPAALGVCSSLAFGAALVFGCGAPLALCAALAVLGAGPRLGAAWAWRSWSSMAGQPPHWALWLAARRGSRGYASAKASMVFWTLSTAALRHWRLPFLAGLAERRALSRVQLFFDALGSFESALWALKAKADKDRSKLECHARALALFLAWGGGETAAAWASRLRHADGLGRKGASAPQEALMALALRWGMLGEAASWAPEAGKGAARHDGGKSLDALPFAEAFDMACQVCPGLDPDGGASAARAGFLAELERGRIAEHLDFGADAAWSAPGAGDPEPSAAPPRSGPRRL